MGANVICNTQGVGRPFLKPGVNREASNVCLISQIAAASEHPSTCTAATVPLLATVNVTNAPSLRSDSFECGLKSRCAVIGIAGAIAALGIGGLAWSVEAVGKCLEGVYAIVVTRHANIVRIMASKLPKDCSTEIGPQYLLGNM